MLFSRFSQKSLNSGLFTSTGRGGGAMITSLLPAWLEARICLRLRQHGLNSVYLVQCLFLLYPLLLCVAYNCAVVDEKDHTIGAIQSLLVNPIFMCQNNNAILPNI
jgi:hypothetical protein